MRVGFLLKPQHAQAVDLARELSDLLASRGHDSVVFVAPHEANAARAPAPQGLAAVDLLVVLGGDGTLLGGAHLVADAGVPILGINLGTLGFLTSCRPEQAAATLLDAVDGRLPIEERMRLRVEVIRGNGDRPSKDGSAADPPDEPIVRYACNDAVLSQGALARLIEIDARLDDVPVATYRADGLIVATPTGSTAYNLAAGGPILAPTVAAMVISPICPHTLTNRPLVVPASSRLSLQPRSNARNVQLTVDGQWGTHVAPEDIVELRSAKRPLRLVKPADTSYFDVLRAKLHWGETGVRATPESPRR